MKKIKQICVVALLGASFSTTSLLAQINTGGLLNSVAKEAISNSGIDTSGLPKEALGFLTTYCAKDPISSLKKSGTSNLISLASGTALSFAQNGSWSSISNLKGLPSSLLKALPSGLVQTLAKSYANDAIQKVENSAQGYAVQLLSGKLLNFNKTGSLIP